MTIKKKKRIYTMKDLTRYDIELLIQASSQPEGSFFCYGMAWYKLMALDLIDEDTQVTREGQIAIRSFQ